MLWWSPVTGSRSRSTNEWREASVLHVTACYRRNASPSAAGDRELLLARHRRSTANFVANLPKQNDEQCLLICYLYTCNWEGFNVFLQHSKVGSLSYPLQIKMLEMTFLFRTFICHIRKQDVSAVGWFEWNVNCIRQETDCNLLILSILTR